ncbi:MlaA family lipoprotein [Sphingomonas sp. Leaf357]|uniref:MlaA family lipoprotein n=1 Tax=Sphingomonas sp. Leaf357 TaxID=1736350 RepID=UPI000B1FE6C6|nr:VacJ family lipoprotein [Sphingomonas sp. Leaf357]
MGLLILTTATVLAVTPMAQVTPQPVEATPTATAAPQETPATPAPIEPPVVSQTTPAPAHTEDQGEVVVTGRDPSNAPDPLRSINVTAFNATQAVDDALVGPISMAYKRTVPSPFRSGVHNVLYNLREPVVFVNFVLQHKIGKAAETVARFAINSTIGVLGIFDMAKRKTFKLPRRSNGFANTLGFYGVPSGPFMFLPIVGPTTVRDLVGGTLDRLILPIAFGKRITKPQFAIPFGVLGVLDHRAEFDETLHTLHDNVPDPYANTRAFYLQRRQAEIDHLRGKAISNSSPMSEAPTGPIRLKSKYPTPPVAPAPAPVPQETAPGDPVTAPRN